MTFMLVIHTDIYPGQRHLGDEETLLDAVALCEDIGALEQLASEHDGHKLKRHDWTDGDLDICQTLENRR